MKALIQRVSRAKVTIEGGDSREIKRGLVVFLGVGRDDEEPHAEKLALKIAGLRIFSKGGKFSSSLLEVNGEALVISQFTLFADSSKGRRPGFGGAAAPEKAEPLYEIFINKLSGAGIIVKGGRFGAHMEVELVNDGPVTVMIEV